MDFLQNLLSLSPLDFDSSGILDLLSRPPHFHLHPFCSAAQPSLPEKLLFACDEWLKQDGMTLESLIGVGEPDIELINMQLEEILVAGHMAITVRLSMESPAAGPGSKGCCNRLGLPLPWEALLSLLVTALYWGWLRETGILALFWGGLTRIGEAISAVRRELVLPCDV